MAQIGTIKVETAGGPVELPVYELGDSGSNRVEAFRVQTASGPGFVPLTEVSAADRPYLRVQTANGVKAFDTSASGIPDSAVLHYPLGERSGSTVTEELVGEDGTVNGTSNISGEWYDGYAEDGDGSNDYIETTTWSAVNFGANLDDAGIIFTIETTTSDRQTLIGSWNDVEEQFFIDINSPNVGEARLFIKDQNGDLNLIDFGGSLIDGNKKRIALRFPTNNANDYRVWVNGTEQSPAIETNETPGNFGNFTYAVTFHANNEQGSPNKHFGGVVDSVIPCLAGPSPSEVSSDYNNQPWS